MKDLNWYAPIALQTKHLYGEEMMKVLLCAMHVACSKCLFALKKKEKKTNETIFSLKLHHERRPLSMKTDIIKKRQRYESNHAHQARKHSKKLHETDISMQSDPFMLMSDAFPNTIVDDVLSNCC